MKNFFKKFKLRKVTVDEIDDRALMINLYATQMLTLSIGLIVIWLQGRNVLHLLVFPQETRFLLWGAAFASVVLLTDLFVGRVVPEDLLDDGGVNERIFQSRAVWHIVLLCFIVSVCEEVLFRGAIQHAWGPYWTSILFAAIHVRYLQHWLMTGLVFGISYGLGWIYIQTGTLWTPIVAHFLIDLVLGCIIRFRRKV